MLTCILFPLQVIVRDIVSKLLIVQFRAHTSPISALCFDPSGTLLVTASVHGQNINVFRIIPPPHGTSEAGQIGTYVHLYKLQRGITNAVSWHTYFLLIICNVVGCKSITFLIGHKRHQL
jgi:WD40 repeat protein